MLSVNLNRNPPWSSGVPFEILKALGGADKTLIVGGAVRDWLCDESIGDIDFATKLPPNESLQLLLDSGFNVKPTGIDHGTITVYSDNNSYEITSLRKDILTFASESLKSHMKVEYCLNNMNISLYDKEGNTIDEKTILQKIKVLLFLKKKKH